MAEAASKKEKTEGIITCPYCGDQVSKLSPIEAGTKLRLQETGAATEVPNEVCDGCLTMLKRMASKGAALLMEQRAKEQNRLLLWRNRVGLVKQAKNQLQNKNYPEAAVSYEKYIRVLELVYDVKPGELMPENFQNDRRSTELTVVASVYWDLMRIYDTHQGYSDRQMKAAEKLATFARFTPIFPYVVRKSESLSLSAKNPEAFKKFLTLSNASRPRCFIATAAFNGRTSEVDSLCRFRDDFLKKTRLGRHLIKTYYRVSPPLAALLDRNPALKPAVRKLLKCVAESDFVRNRLNP